MVAGAGGSIVAEEDIVILKVLSGSRAYGLDSPDSDYDLHGVFVAPTARLLSLGAKVADAKRFDGIDQENTGWEIRHFLELALNGNPTAIETFVAPLVEANETGNALRALLPAVLSRKRIYDAVTGFSRTQRARMFESTGKEAHTRSAKSAIAYLRSMWHGIELLRAGSYNPFIEEEGFRNLLHEVRSANTVPFPKVIEKAMELETELTAAYLASTVREEPDMSRVNTFLLDVRRQYWQ